MQTFWAFSAKYLKPYLWWYILGFVFVFGTQFLVVAIIDQTASGIDGVRAEGATAATITPYATWVAIFAVSMIFVRTASRLLIFTPGRLIEYNVRNDYFASLLRLQRDYLGNHESGDLVSRCTNDIGFIRAAYGFALLQVANVTATMVLGFGAMFRMDATTTAYIIIPMIVSFAIIQGSIRFLFKYWRYSNEQIGDLSSLCLASYKGVSAIQNYHAEPAVQQHFERLNAAYLHTSTVIARTKSFFLPLVQLVGNLSVFLVLWFAGRAVLQGDLTVGQISAFLGLIMVMMPPLLSVGWMMNVFNRALPAMERLDEILTAEPNLLPVDKSIKQPARGQVKLETRGLSFEFSEDKDHAGHFHLQDVSFELPPGKVLGVVGPLGAGKTVLLDTVTRLNPPEAGQLFVNGQDAAKMDLSHFRKLFAIAPQRPFLFSTTLRRNLMMALPAEKWAQPDVESELMKVLSLAGFNLDGEQFPEGLETEVGEKGIMLSGGQRQRIALARALLKEADIYILDDVLSAVDHDTEKRIIGNLKQFSGGKSFIIAAHRISALQWADEILVLDEGNVVDRGTHDELIARSGFYQEVHQYQSQSLDGDA